MVILRIKNLKSENLSLHLQVVTANIKSAVDVTAIKTFPEIDIRLYHYAELSKIQEHSRIKVGLISIVDYNNVILEIAGIDTDNDLFMKLSEALQEGALEQPLLKNVTEETPCIAKFSEDEMWYRAQIVEKINENVARVWFVDFGNFDDVEMCNIRDIRSDWLSYPLQHFPAMLEGVELVDESKANEVSIFLNKFCSTVQVAYIFSINPLKVALYDEESDKLLYQNLIDSGILKLKANV